jgi:galactokinase
MRDLTLEALMAGKDKLSEAEFIRARHAVTEISRVLSTVEALKAGDFNAVGALINQSHNSLRDDYAVSCPELDLAVEAARSAGALGARMVGGGFGGSAIALLRVEDVEKARTAITDAFSKDGFKKPRFFTSLPSAGASALLSSKLQ